ncbi:hypothetical protein CMI46_01335 [Candidatus Pacearchaeota archaeon]|nr:hypothetical protein [Candidatus Pacearchaeota archaeon]|tara:strand:- start:8656 stop:9354 length:699 start_codon:yes stop_codon:yes gene_type:complete
MVDKRKIEHSIRGIYRSKFIPRFFYVPVARVLLYILAVLRIPYQIVNTSSLILATVAVILIVFYPALIVLAGVLIFFSFVMEIVNSAWAKYNNGNLIYQKWVDETNGSVKIFLIFLAGALFEFQISGNWSVFILLSAAVFSYMMMTYSGTMISLFTYKYSQKEDITEILKRKFAPRIRWIIKSPLSFSFEYQWTLIVICVLFGLFDWLFWFFIIFGNLKWIQGYYLMSKIRE